MSFLAERAERFDESWSRSVSEIIEKLAQGLIANRRNFSNSFARKSSGFWMKVRDKIRKKAPGEITSFGQI